MVMVGIEMLHLLRARMRSACRARRVGRKRCWPEDCKARCDTAHGRYRQYEAHDTGLHRGGCSAASLCGGFLAGLAWRSGDARSSSVAGC